MLLSPGSLVAAAEQLRGGGDGLRFAVAETDADPLEFVRAAAGLYGAARYVATPDGLRVGSVGTAWRAQASGPQRFDLLEQAWRERPDMPEATRLLVGFAFAPDGPRSELWDGFASSEIVLPEVAVVAAGGAGPQLVVALPSGVDVEGVLGPLRTLEPPQAPRLPGLGDHSVHAVPSGADWCLGVEEAVAAIEDGGLQKVVLARSVVIDAEMSIDAFEIVHHLAERNPQCHVFGWQVGDSAFIGASPELLVGTRGGEVYANPLAGSARRGIGDDEDHAVGQALLASSKDRQEHALVVEDITTRLAPLTSHLDVPSRPSLRRVATVQHLMTEIRGTMDNGASLLGLSGRLHPTPAVGGTPRHEAMAFIEKVEVLDRGWYSGGIGWISPDGDGDVAVALRCALVSGHVAHLYAGNGIVADSDPQSELVETRWKLGPLFNLLTAT